MNLSGKILRNNFIMSAVKTGYGDGSGNITERHVAFWNRRSKHVSAVIFEPFFIDKRVRELPTQIGIDNDGLIEPHKMLVKAVHDNGAFAIAHINHPGRMANPKLPGNIYISASDVRCQNGGQKPVPMSIKDIIEVQKQYSDAAIRAEKSGYDFIELQFGLGYLIAQFLSPKTNLRKDEYGGSFENRLRFGIEILEKIKNAVSLPVIIRISGDEKAEGGLNLENTISIIKILETKNIAAVHITSGNVCDSAPWYYQHHFIPKGANWEMAKKIKNEINIPVITVGQITEPGDVKKIFSENAADIIALGRTLIADPDFVGKFLNMVPGRIRPCSSCLTGCLGRIKIGKGLQCEINPEVGRETEAFVKAETVKDYAVVGGGLAGLQAAKTLKERGHNVTLFEKSRLGGQFNLAPLPPHKNSLQKQIDSLKDEIEGVKVISLEAHPEDLIGKFDGVIAATGSLPFIPPIPGLKKYSWAEILYEENMPENKNVVVIGGGMIGVEVANALIDRGNKIIIIEMLDEIARGMEMITRKLNIMKLQKSNARIYTNCKVFDISGSEVHVIKNDNPEEKIILDKIDVFVVAAGMKPDTRLADQLKDKIPTYVIGDAGTVGDAVSAVQSAYFTCKDL